MALRKPAQTRSAFVNMWTCFTRFHPCHGHGVAFEFPVCRPEADLFCVPLSVYSDLLQEIAGLFQALHVLSPGVVMGEETATV